MFWLRIAFFPQNSFIFIGVKLLLPAGEQENAEKQVIYKMIVRHMCQAHLESTANQTLAGTR